MCSFNEQSKFLGLISLEIRFEAKRIQIYYRTLFRFLPDSNLASIGDEKRSDEIAISKFYPQKGFLVHQGSLF
jgi:hypothetical protein